jgi:glycine/serine hydroxymethyltransferase
MTRFGMREEDFRTLASLIHDVISNNAKALDQVKKLRKGFTELQFCFQGQEQQDIMESLHNLL